MLYLHANDFSRFSHWWLNILIRGFWYFLSQFNPIYLFINLLFVLLNLQGRKVINKIVACSENMIFFKYFNTCIKAFQEGFKCYSSLCRLCVFEKLLLNVILNITEWCNGLLNTGPNRVFSAICFICVLFMWSGAFSSNQTVWQPTSCSYSKKKMHLV